MANPTLGWDRIPVYGWWSDNPGVPAKGHIELTMTQRIRRVDGRMIYPGGAQRRVTIGDQDQHEVDVRAAVKAGMKARDMAAHGEDWDEAAWEARWDQNLAAAIFTSYWAADDPDITPHGVGDDGYKVLVREALLSGAGKPYNIQPLISDLSLPIPGINLADIEVPPGTPSVPAPIYAKGRPGGVAALSAAGQVLNADGEVVGEVSEAMVGDALEAYVIDNPDALGVSEQQATTIAATAASGAVGTANAYTDQAIASIEPGGDNFNHYETPQEVADAITAGTEQVGRVVILAPADAPVVTP